MGREASPPSSTSHVTGAARGRAPRRLVRARRGGAPGAQGRDFVPPRVRSESPFFARARICYVASEDVIEHLKDKDHLVCVNFSRNTTHS